MVSHFWGRCQSRIGSTLGSLVAVLLGLSLLFQSPAVSADSTPYPARLNSQAYSGTVYVSPIFPTTLQACEWLVGNWPNTSSPFFTNDYPPGQGYASGICYASQPHAIGPITFGLWKRYTECFNGGQVDDATVATPMCSCPVGWMFPPGGLVYGGPPCVPNPCPVPDLKDKPTDACSVALETGRGLPVPATACPTPSVMTDPKGEACLRDKLAVLGIPYAGPTATIRTVAYQDHLRDVWNRNEDHKKITDPAERNACAAKRAIVENEMKNIHGLKYRPGDESEHITGKSFDISEGTIIALDATLGQAGRSVSGLLRSPPFCTLIWGGTYRKPDIFHFTSF